MAVDYYSRIMDCINHVQDQFQDTHEPPIFQLNKRQCEYVTRELLKASEVLIRVKSACKSLGNGAFPRTVLLHLHAIVKRAQILVERCCSKNTSWLTVALSLGDTKEEVIAILLDLHQWTFVLDIHASAGGSQSAQFQQLFETGEEGYRRLSKEQSKMQNAIRDAARQDREELLERITNSLSEDQRDDDYIRGLYLKPNWLNPAGGDLQTVEELKAYKISRDLGSGASGMVLQVHWLGQEFALKILKLVDKREAIILGRLHHPNVVRLYYYWEEYTPYPRSCIVRELMPRDLQKHIVNATGKRSKLPLKSKKGVTACMPFLLSGN